MVDNRDDPTIPAGTFRAWFIGTIFVAAGYVDHHSSGPCRTLGTPCTFTDCRLHRAFINQFFSIRQPGIVVTSNVAQLLAFPAGKLLEAVLPTREFTTFGYAWSLNSGKFNLKEHMVITIMANIGFALPFTNYVRLCMIYPAQSSA